MPREYLRQLETNQRIIYTFDENALARANIFVDDGFLALTTTIDGATDRTLIPAGRSWSSGSQQRLGITNITLESVPDKPNPTITYDIGPDAGDPDIFTSGGVTPVERVSLANRSGSITAANTPQNMIDADVARRYLFIQNIDAAIDLWINLSGDAAAAEEGSIRLGPFDSWVSEGSAILATAVSGISTKVGHRWTAYEG